MRDVDAPLLPRDAMRGQSSTHVGQDKISALLYTPTWWAFAGHCAHMLCSRSRWPDTPGTRARGRTKPPCSHRPARRIHQCKKHQMRAECGLCRAGRLERADLALPLVLGMRPVTQGLSVSFPQPERAVCGGVLAIFSSDVAGGENNCTPCKPAGRLCVWECVWME